MKVLLISHNPITTCNNMGKTLGGLLAGLKKEELCQLYVYPSLPDTDACGSYFRVTDRDILRSYVCFSVKSGTVESCAGTPCDFASRTEQRLFQGRNKHSPAANMLRDGMWKLSRWYNGALRRWLSEQRPTCILTAPGQNKFLYDMTMQISRSLKIPVVTYVCDDFFFSDSGAGGLHSLMRRLLRRKIRELMGCTSHLISICDPLTLRYEEAFSVPATTVMTAADYPAAACPRDDPHPDSITYMGNIRCGRARSLADVGRALDEMNRRDGTAYTLRIYTGEENPEVLAPLAGIASVRMCGFVSADAFDRAFFESRLLLHTESFEPAYMETVRYSVSTKIADCMASGICTIAYGPAGIASMDYLSAHRAAFVMEDRSCLQEGLRRIMTDAALRRHTVENALALAAARHDAAANRRLVRNILQDAERERA